MPCPYAERRGALVYCKVSGKTVNPIAYPCLGTKYDACPYYRQARQKAEAEEAKPAAKPEAKPAAREARPPTARAARPRRASVGIRGLTRLGGLPDSCLECIFYAKGKAWCLILGSRVENAEEPPCSKAA